MATAFLGYLYSPKWFRNINLGDNSRLNSTRSILCLRNKYKPANTIRSYSTSTRPSNYSSSVTKFLEEKNLKSVFMYEDLNTEEIKNTIIKDTENLSGVYLILNKITGDYYIGSASTNKIYSRFYRHLLNFTGSRIVKLAVKKYGLDNFAFFILELYPDIITIENNKNLLDLEDFYLKSLLPNYNILTEAGSNFGYRHTEVDRIKMKANYSESRRARIGNLNKNKVFSEEVIQKMRESALKRKKPIFSEKALNNMKKKSKSITLYNLGNRTVYGKYPSIKEAALFVNSSEKTIIRSLKTEKKVLLRR